MSVLFIKSKDIPLTSNGQKGVSRPKNINGDSDLLEQALSEIIGGMNPQYFYTTAELYNLPPAAKVRRPSGVQQGRKAIERQLSAHSERLGVRKNREGHWKKS